jgi:hypothetical protein
VIYGGGAPDARTGKVNDPEALVEFFVKVQCDVCGHAQFFNAERHRPGDEKIMKFPPVV